MARRKQRKYARPAVAKTTALPKNGPSDLVRFEGFRFGAALALSCIGLYTLIFALPDDYLGPINEHTARTLGHVLNAFGIAASTIGDTVSGVGVAFKIIPECTVLLSVGLFSCFVTFYPAPIPKKTGGLLLGVSVLYLGNLVRLTLLFMIGRYDRRLFEVSHVYLGQVFTIALVFFSCILWLKWLAREEPKERLPIKIVSFLGRFVVISGCMFFLWLEVHHYYIWFVDRFMILGFSLFGWRLMIPRNTAIYYETFNIVTFTSLMLATQGIKPLRRMKGLVIGLGVLFLLHLVHRIDNVFMTAFGSPSVIPVDYVLCAVGQYLLPVGLWLAVALSFASESKRETCGTPTRTATFRQRSNAVTR
jgi:exosortase H (IPTLxxWG-CTERM-specific)